jgi:hypothetical protein
MYTDEEIAIVVHEANCGIQYITGDPSPSDHWPALDPETRLSAISGVQKARQGLTPRQMHDEWFRDRLEHGWTYGPTKDRHHKTHPCMVPYSELPPSQRIKDELFIAITSLMASAISDSPSDRQKNT